MKRIFLVLAMLAGSVFLAVSPASAHTQNMSVSAVCQANGTYDVTFTLNYASGAAPGKAFKRTGTTSFSNGWSPSTFNDWQSAGTLNSGSGSLTWHRTLPGTTTVAPWEYTYIEWNDKFVTKGDTRPEGLKGNCLPPDDTNKKVDICHLPPGNPANGQSVNVDYASIINGTGHGDDGLDIIPPFNYVKKGVNGSFPGQNWTAQGQAQYNNGCIKTKPDQPAPKVEDKNEAGQPNCTNKTVTTTFYTRTTPYVFNETSWTWNLGTPGAWVVDHTTSRAATSRECPTTVTPVAPTATAITKCGTDGLVVLPITDGVTYAFDPAGSSPTQGAWKVTASPKAGFVFADGATTSWNGNLGTHTECPVVVLPVAPTVTDITKCGEFGSVTFVETKGVTYAFDPSGGSPKQGVWKVVATAKPGFVFADGATTSWSGNLGTHTTCATPIAPVVTEITKCGTDGLVVLPITDGVTYAFDPAGNSPKQGPWKVKASPKAGFSFADGVTTSWSGNLGTRTECPVAVLPVAPAVTEITKCGEFGSVSLPETKGVTYAFDPSGDSPTEGAWKVVATANRGFVFADGATTSWNGNLGAHTTCATPIAPAVTEITKCDMDGLVVLPITDGVTYAFDPAGDSPTQGPWKVKASPKAGFSFAEGATTSWNGNLGAHTTCVSPIAPAVTEITKCDMDGLVVLPETDGVTYAFDPSGDSPTEGAWKVVATANRGFVFADGATTGWNGNLGTHTTCATPIAPAVTAIEACGEFGSIVLPETDGVTYAFDPSGDSPTEGVWKVVATAKDGFSFADGATTSWSGNLGTHTTCATPIAPVVTEITKCGTDGLVVLPITDGVTYAFDPSGDSPKQGAWKVVATANEGFSFATETQASWSGDLGARTECVTPVAPTVKTACGEDGTVTLLGTEGVIYAFTVGNGVSGEWTVKATPAEGFGFAEGTVSQWNGTVTPPDACVKQVIADVIALATCDGASTPFPTVVEGVVYAFTVGNGFSGPWEVTATAKAGYELVGPAVFAGNAGDESGCVRGVSLEAGDEDAEEEEALLPDTGGSSLGLLLIGGLLTVAGAAVVGRRRILN